MQQAPAAAPPTPQAEGTPPATVAGKYLTFRLDSEEYGLEILRVQEIIKMLDITHVPRTPAFVRGVINLRGKVIPIIDIRAKFSMPPREKTEKTCIIVVQIPHNDSLLTMGIIVDEVSEVLDIPAEQIEPPPQFGTSVETHFILGMAKTQDSVKILLNTDSVLACNELSNVSEIAA